MKPEYLARKHGKKGFTLIEIMIVIAIIGILATIAITNFIGYRDNTFCSRAESDANAVAAAVSDYFAIPAHTEVPDIQNDLNITLSGSGTDKNTGTITSNDVNAGITISVTDSSGRCPAEYQTASTGWSKDAGGAANSIYIKRLKP